MNVEFPGGNIKGSYTLEEALKASEHLLAEQEELMKEALLEQAENEESIKSLKEAHYPNEGEILAHFLELRETLEVTIISLKNDIEKTTKNIGEVKSAKTASKNSMN